MNRCELRINYTDSIAIINDTSYWVLHIKYHNTTPNPYILCLNRWSIDMGSIIDCGREYMCFHEPTNGYNHIAIKRLHFAPQIYTERERMGWFTGVVKEANPILKLVVPNDSFLVNLFIPDTMARWCLKKEDMKIDFFPMREISKVPPKEGFIKDACFNVLFKSYKEPYFFYNFWIDVTPAPPESRKFALLRRKKHCKIANERTVY